MVQNTKKGMDESSTKKGSSTHMRDEAEKPSRTPEKNPQKKPDTSSSSRKTR